MQNTKKIIMASGGRRPGSGRHMIPAAERRQNTTLRLSPVTLKRIALIRAAGFQVSRVVDDLIEAFCRHAGLEPGAVADVAEKEN